MLQLLLVLSTLLLSPSEDYFQTIYKAEDCLLSFNYQGAVKNYETAFALEGAPFLKDVHNALICAIRCKDNPKIELFVTYMSKFNIAKEYLDQPVFTDSLKNEPVWVFMKETLYKEKKTTSELYTKLDSLYVLDQDIREQCKQIATNYYSVCNDTILYIDSINLIALTAVIDKFGFPGDDVYSNYLPGNLPEFLWIIGHNKTQIRQIIAPQLEAAVTNLSFHPQLFSFIWGGNNDVYQYQEFGLGYSILLDNELYVFNLTDQKFKDKININRKKFLLDDLDTYNEKIKFQYFNPEFKLLYSILFFSIDGFDQETKEMLATKWKDALVTSYSVR